MALAQGDKVAVQFQGWYEAPAAAVMPATPRITSFSEGNQAITITVDGDAGVTNTMYLRKPGDTDWTTGSSRTGDGDITTSSLDNKVTFEIVCVSSDGGSTSLPSRSIFVQPRAAEDDATLAPIPSYLDAMRVLYLNSPNLLAWIQSVDGTETTGGHVFLNWSPQTLVDIQTKGPVVLLRWENLRLDNEGGPFTFAGQIGLVADHVWHSTDAHLKPDRFIREITFLDKIINEFIGDIGIALDSTFGASLSAVDAPGAILQDARDDEVMHSEITYTLRIGKDG